MKTTPFLFMALFLLLTSAAFAVTPSSRLIIQGVNCGQDDNFYYSTSVTVFNPNNWPVKVTANFLKEGPDNFNPPTTEFIIEPGESYPFWNVLPGLFGVYNAEGMLEFFSEKVGGNDEGVPSDVIASGYYRQELKSDRRVVVEALALPAIPASAAAKTFSFIGYHLNRSTWGEQAVFFLVNMGNEPATVSLLCFAGLNDVGAMEEVFIQPREVKKISLSSIGCELSRLGVKSDQPTIGSMFFINSSGKVVYFEMTTPPLSPPRAKKPEHN